jgi:hypothetical protein
MVGADPRSTGTCGPIDGVPAMIVAYIQLNEGATDRVALWCDPLSTTRA